MTTCSSCSTSMVTQMYEGIEIDHCPKCGATWLDEREISGILAAEEVTFTEEQMRDAIKSRGQDSGADRKHQPGSCPKCKAPMEIMNYAFNSGILIDRCPAKCGVFLDHGELEKLQILVEEQRNRLDSSESTNRNEQKMCPRDNVALVIQTYENVEVDHCDSCGGLWLDDEELLQIIRDRSTSFDKSNAGKKQNKSVSLEMDLVMSLPCPVCRKTMKRSNYQYSSGIVVDRCPHHGIWLDHGEIDRIQIFAEGWQDQEDSLRDKYAHVLSDAARDAERSYDAAKKRGFDKGKGQGLFGAIVSTLTKS